MPDVVAVNVIGAPAHTVCGTVNAADGRFTVTVCVVVTEQLQAGDDIVY
jgi:hypothetical protein